MGIRVIPYLIAVLLLGCNNIDKIIGNKPYLELTDSSPYNLKISDFEWGYGRVRFNQFNGDFERLDEMVFDLLNGKNGTVSVYLLNSQKDQYGNSQDTTVFIGEIDLSELNKYKDWAYWHKSAGIQSLLYKKFVNPDVQADSSVVEYDPPTVNPEPVSVPVTTPVSTPKTFSLEQTDLYPDSEDRANQDYQTYTKPIVGTIKYADFYNGVLEVNGEDGELYALRLLADNLPTSLKSDVRYFLKAGNKIWCICTVAGARELEIVQVKLTEQ